LQGVLESVGAGWGLGATEIGLPFASKTTMVIGGKRGWYIGTRRAFVPEGMLCERLSTFRTVNILDYINIIG